MGSTDHCSARKGVVLCSAGAVLLLAVVAAEGVGGSEEVIERATTEDGNAEVEAEVEVE